MLLNCNQILKKISGKFYNNIGISSVFKILNLKIYAIYMSLLISFQCAGTSPEEFFKSGHTNNWAVLVDTSRFWFNYRHVANVLSIYRSCKRLGIPDRFGVFQYIHVQIIIVLRLICCFLRNE